MNKEDKKPSETMYITFDELLEILNVPKDINEMPQKDKTPVENEPNSTL